MRNTNVWYGNLNDEQKMIYINARSLLANFNEIELLCKNFRPTILACSEARITSEINECEYSIGDYETVVCHSNSRHTGGCVIYIRNDMKFRVIHNDVINDHLWYVSIEFWQHGISSLTHVFYRSPNKKFKSKCIVKVMVCTYKKL